MSAAAERLINKIAGVAQRKKRIKLEENQIIRMIESCRSRSDFPVRSGNQFVLSSFMPLKADTPGSIQGQITKRAFIYLPAGTHRIKCFINQVVWQDQTVFPPIATFDLEGETAYEVVYSIRSGKKTADTRPSVYAADVHDPSRAFVEVFDLEDRLIHVCKFALKDSPATAFGGAGTSRVQGREIRNPDKFFRHRHFSGVQPGAHSTIQYPNELVLASGRRDDWQSSPGGSFVVFPEFDTTLRWTDNKTEPSVLRARVEIETDGPIQIDPLTIATHYRSFLLTEPPKQLQKLLHLENNSSSPMCEGPLVNYLLPDDGVGIFFLNFARTDDQILPDDSN